MGPFQASIILINAGSLQGCSWFIYILIDWLIDWLISWLVGWLVGWLIYLFIYLFIYWFIFFIDKLINWLMIVEIWVLRWWSLYWLWNSPIPCHLSNNADITLMILVDDELMMMLVMIITMDSFMRIIYWRVWLIDWLID